MNILQSSRKNIHVASSFRAVIFLVTGFHPDLQYICELCLFFFLNGPLHLTGRDRSYPSQQSHYDSSRHIRLSCQYFQTQGQHQRRMLVTVLYHQPSFPVWHSEANQQDGSIQFSLRSIFLSYNQSRCVWYLQQQDLTIQFCCTINSSTNSLYGYWDPWAFLVSDSTSVTGVFRQ